MVEAVFAEGKKVSAYTDANGNVNLYIPTYHIKETGTYKLDIKISGDILKDYLKSFDINVGDSKIEEKPTLTVNPSKDTYSKDEKVNLEIASKLGKKALAYTDLDIKITSPNGDEFKDSIKTNELGIANYIFNPDKYMATGQYKVEVICLSSSYKDLRAQTSFKIVDEESGIRVDFSQDKNLYYLGDRANIKIKLTDPKGKPLKNYKFNIKVKGPNDFNYDLEKTTDYSANASLFIKPTKSIGSGTYKIEISPAKDSKDKLSASYQIDFIDPNNKPMNMEISGFSDSYKKNERIKGTVFLRDEKNYNLKDVKITFTLFDNSDKKIDEKILKTSYTGRVTYNAPSLKEGSYRLKVKSQKSSYKDYEDEIKFLVK